MPPQDETGEKTEDATPRQRERAREEGRVASSREVGTFFILSTATFVIYFFGPFMTDRLMRVFIRILNDLPNPDLSMGATVILLRRLFLQSLLILGPLFLALVVAAIAAYSIQVGFLFVTKPLQPKGSRINPIEGAKRLFSTQILAETAKAIFKLIVVGVVSYMVIKPMLPGAVALMDNDPNHIIPNLLWMGFKVAGMILIFLLAVALFDYAYQRWRYEKSIRMSRYEVKQELKESEGDPQIKARVRSIRQQQARTRMMAEVPEAEVVITNPTHFAVAIRYESEMREAPHVLARGRGVIAQRIKEIALEHDVPFYEDPWLARQLYFSCRVGDMIPFQLWEAVARVLAFVRSLDQRKAAVEA